MLRSKQYRQLGFTLAELLIALTILGVIAAFTIPKVLNAQGDKQKSAIAKEAASAVASAWVAYKQENATTGTTELTVLEDRLNYVAKYTSGVQGDEAFYEDGMICNASDPCYRLHSGAVIQLLSNSFGGTAATNAVGFYVDPDGEYSGQTDGPGKGIEFSMYYSGRLASWGTVAPGTQYSGGAYNACVSCDPDWFTWN